MTISNIIQNIRTENLGDLRRFLTATSHLNDHTEIRVTDMGFEGVRITAIYTDDNIIPEPTEPEKTARIAQAIHENLVTFGGLEELVEFDAIKERIDKANANLTTIGNLHISKLTTCCKHCPGDQQP